MIEPIDVALAVLVVLGVVVLVLWQAEQSRKGPWR